MKVRPCCLYMYNLVLYFDLVLQVQQCSIVYDLFFFLSTCFSVIPVNLEDVFVDFCEQEGVR